MRNIEQDVPIKGLTVRTHEGTWVVHVEDIEEPAQNNTWWRFNLRLDGPEELRVTIVVTSETLVIEHPTGDPSWILDALRDWISQPAVERGEELWLTADPR